jgi:hypothetical protein
MTTYFYPEIPCREDEYERVRRFWHDLVANIARQTDQENEWLPWGATTFADGTPLPRDGNPILALRSERLARALRIIQWSPETKSKEKIGAWIDTLESAMPPGLNSMDELVISLVLSPETEAIAQKLIEHWMNPANSRAAITTLIDALR